jgi:beta-glucanase (GH16 family)
MPSQLRIGLFAALCSLAAAALSAAAQQDPPGWQLIWADEFDSAVLDVSKWDVADKPGNTNNELQYYAPDEVYLEQGSLILRSRERPHQGRDYTSGLVHSRQLFAQTFGRVEVRAKLPGTQGIWPAHWMLPETGAWPPEIDITELKGQQPHTVYMTHHWGQWPNVHSNGTTYTGPDFTAGYHTFAVEWSPGRIRWFIDDVPRFESVNQNVPAEPMYLILNTAIGGDFVGSPDGSTVFPQHHSIDYIRVYTRDDPGDAHHRIVDSTLTGPVFDGTIEPGEYVGSFLGINNGFGDRIGAGSRCALDSDRDGWLYLGLDSATLWPADDRDGLVFYFDTQPGGMTSTITMIDNTDRPRALASGRARLGGEQVDLFFPDGFAADRALVLQDGRATLLQLNPWFHSVINATDLGANSDMFGGDALVYRRSDTDPTMRELRLRLSDIGTGFSTTVRTLATLLDADTANRSNEYLGVAPGHWFDSVPTTREDVQLDAGSFAEFVTSAEFCPGDINEDGRVDTLDFLQFLAWWAAGDLRADFVHDGVINTLDMLAFLALWNAVCP